MAAPILGDERDPWRQRANQTRGFLVALAMQATLVLQLAKGSQL